MERKKAEEVRRGTAHNQINPYRPAERCDGGGA